MFPTPSNQQAESIRDQTHSWLVQARNHRVKKTKLREDKELLWTLPIVLRAIL